MCSLYTSKSSRAVCLSQRLFCYYYLNTTNLKFIDDQKSHVLGSKGCIYNFPSFVQSQYPTFPEYSGCLGLQHFYNTLNEAAYLTPPLFLSELFTSAPFLLPDLIQDPCFILTSLQLPLIFSRSSIFPYPPLLHNLVEYIEVENPSIRSLFSSFFNVGLKFYWYIHGSRRFQN